MSGGTRKELREQKNCMERKEVANKADKLAWGTSMRGHPKRLSQDGPIL